MAAITLFYLLFYKYQSKTGLHHKSGERCTNSPNSTTLFFTEHYEELGGTQAANNYTYDAIGNLTGNVAENIGTADGSGYSNGDGITWTVYGKIASISKATHDGNETIRYTYDVAGNRLSKTVVPPAGGAGTTTWYVRDASGNVMSIYTAGDNNIHTGNLSQTEVPMYGSSRLGMTKPTTDGTAAGIDVHSSLLPVGESYNDGMDNYTMYHTTFVRGTKLFELSNHLGNVLVTISDKKIAVGNAFSTYTFDHFAPDVITANDYYPFGMVQPGRQYAATTSTGYRFGFNGKENDNDIESGAQEYGMRIYDSRIGKFLSVDPLTPKYPGLTPYQFASNTPLQAIDLDGEEAMPVITGKEVEGTSTSTSEEWIQGRSDKVYTRTQEWVYHEGGFNGSTAGYMTAEDYFKEVLKPLGKAINNFDFNTVNNFINSRKSNPGASNPLNYQSYYSQYLTAIDKVGDYVKANPTYDSWARWIPIWGSFKQASLDFGAGNYGRGIFNSVLAITDIALVKSILAAPLKEAFISSLKYLPRGGLDFEAYKLARGGTETLQQIWTFNKAGQPVLQRISTEYSHTFITQRAQRALGLPNWLVNNRLNVWELNTVQHALIDNYRFNFLRYGFKSDVGWFGKYNWFTKFPTR